MRTTRRNFVLSTTAVSAAAQNPPPGGRIQGYVKVGPPAPPRPATQLGVSLALWSMNQSFWVGKWKLLDMPGIMKNQLGIEGIEYVNQSHENPRRGEPEASRPDLLEVLAAKSRMTPGAGKAPPGGACGSLLSIKRRLSRS
jgi:hypothetical protein